MVVIHDNMLVLCKDCEDAYTKLVKVIQLQREESVLEAVEVDVWCEEGQFLRV